MGAQKTTYSVMVCIYIYIVYFFICLFSIRLHRGARESWVVCMRAHMMKHTEHGARTLKEVKGLYTRPHVKFRYRQKEEKLSHLRHVASIVNMAPGFAVQPQWPGLKVKDPKEEALEVLERGFVSGSSESWFSPKHRIVERRSIDQLHKHL